MAHNFNPSIWKDKAGGTLEFEVSLVYTVSSRSARVTERHLSQTNKLTTQTNIHTHKFTYIYTHTQRHRFGMTKNINLFL